MALGRALGPLGLAKTGQQLRVSMVGVAGYGNLGAPSLAALPSSATILVEKSALLTERITKSASDPATSHDTAPKSRQKQIRKLENESQEMELPKRDCRVLDRQKQVRRRDVVNSGQSEFLSKSRRWRADRNGPAEPKSQRITNNSLQPDLLRGSEACQKQRPRRPESLASLAASAAAVAVVGTGASADKLQCVTIRIGGVEVQVPMLARGSKSQGRQVKTASELEADMHRLILTWDIEAALTCVENDRGRFGRETICTLKRLPLRFHSADEYEDIVTPLLMNECFEQVCSTN